MKLSDFHFKLPEELIAHYPLENRTDSRLLCLDKNTGEINHQGFSYLPNLLNANDLLIFNNTKVIPARLFGRKESGGNVEILIERIIDSNKVIAQLRASKSPKPGTRIYFNNESTKEFYAEVIGREEGFFCVKFKGEAVLDVLDQIGHMPLPPYIKRADEALDRDRYQTVYSKKKGAVAAPTAGLHFDEALMSTLAAKGITTAFVTLHVGAGTFQPVRTDSIEDHNMHSEYLEVDEDTCQKVKECRARGARVVAVGTTSVRCLETASASGEVEPFRGDTNIFIYPGYEFKSVDALITNFHLPESTLIMLVSAFAGLDKIMTSYSEAIEEKYRFFSYGDAMFIA